MPGSHSLLGASGAHRWLNCPGSFGLSRTAPHRPSSIYAARGSLAHDFIEAAVKDALDNKTLPQVDKSEIGATLTYDGHAITIDEDFVHGVNVMLDYLNTLTAVSDWVGGEFSVSLDPYFQMPPPVPVFGRVDVGALMLWDKLLEIVDYKNGSGVSVTPKENPQLLFYAAGALMALLPHQQTQVEKIKLTIVQPHGPGVPIRSWEISTVDLLMWVNDTLIPGVEATTQPDAPFVTGSWCRFCPVVHACPALHQAALETAQRDFDEIPTDLAAALDTAERATLWAERLREFALEALQRQVKIPGWGLVPTRPTRKWTLDDTKVANTLRNMQLDENLIWETRVRSPAQLEKQVLRSGGGHAVWDVIARNLVESRSSGVKVGRDRSSPEEEFDVEV